jgi:hypothetical protein
MESFCRMCAPHRLELYHVLAEFEYAHARLAYGATTNGPHEVTAWPLIGTPGVKL